ncbi:MAG: hypothetical protein R3F24_12680 [Gammaproteobacteria bacterium]
MSANIDWGSKEHMAVSATNSALSGLSRRLVQDSLIAEEAVRA